VNRLTRRSAIGRAFATLTIVLAGCSTSAQANVQQAITDVGNIVGQPPSASLPGGSGLQGAYAAFKTLYPGLVPASVDAQIQSAFAQAPGYLAALSASAAAASSTTASNLSGLLSIGSQVLNLLAPLITASVASNPAFAAGMLLFQAATVLLPYVQGVISQIAPSQAVAAVIVPQVFVKPGMTADQARQILGPK
jgi:hypothetical protein